MVTPTGQALRPVCGPAPSVRLVTGRWLSASTGDSNLAQTGVRCSDPGHTGGMTAEDVGRLARRLTTGLYVHAAALELVRDPRVRDLAPAGNPLEDPPAGLVQRKDGTLAAYDWLHHLNVAQNDPLMAVELNRAWLVSALIELGDRLAAEDYFDRVPLLEMVRHLRNGVSHGNRFEIRDPKVLLERPAHTRDAACRGQTTFEITPDLNGTPVLFDFMGPGDVLDVLISVGTHLLRQGRQHSRVPAIVGPTKARRKSGTTP